MFAFARFVLVLDLIAVIGAGIQLYLLSESARTRLEPASSSNAAAT
jgi:hypothetical protein